MPSFAEEAGIQDPEQFLPEAEEPALSAADAQRLLLVKLIERALRSEGGVRHNQKGNKPTGYYAGRRTGFISSAASLCSALYGVEEEAAKSIISAGVKRAGDDMAGAMPNHERNERLAMEIAVQALLAR